MKEMKKLGILVFSCYLIAVFDQVFWNGKKLQVQRPKSPPANI